MVRLTQFARTRVVHLKRQGLTFVEICQRLEEDDGIETSRQSVSKFWRKFSASGDIKPGHGGGRPAVLQEEHLDFLDAQMTKNSELSGPELQIMFKDTFDIEVSHHTILRCRRKQGWTYGQTRYCQMISEKNQPLRKAFAEEMIRLEDAFDDVIFTDECIVQMGCNARRQCYKKGAPLQLRLRPKAKHPFQVFDIECNYSMSIKSYRCNQTREFPSENILFNIPL